MKPTASETETLNPLLKSRPRVGLHSYPTIQDRHGLLLIRQSDTLCIILNLNTVALVRIFKNAWFERFARKQNIANEALLEAIRQADQGLIDANLGGGVLSNEWRVLDKASLAGTARSSCIARDIEHSSCTALPRVNRAISAEMRKRPSRRRLNTSLAYRKSTWSRWFKKASFRR